MKLPQFVTDITPIGAVLSAEETGERLLASEIEKRNARMLVETADGEGLSQWEADYGLPDGTSADDTLRRGRIRGAMAEGQTLTVDRLETLALSVAGADGGEVRENYSGYSAELTVIRTGKLPEIAGMEALCQTLARQKPAHLGITSVPCALLPLNRAEACHGGTLHILYADAPSIT